MRNVNVIMDYDVLNKLLEDITGENLELNRKNAKNKIMKLYYEKALKMQNLNILIDCICENHSEGIGMIETAGDAKIYCNTMNTARILLEKEYDNTMNMYLRLMINLIVDDNILEILKDDMPNLVQINNIMNDLDEEYSGCDLSEIIEKVVDYIENFFIDDMSKEEFFELVDNLLDEFANEERIREFYE